jgi:hypothetical protein
MKHLIRVNWCVLVQELANHSSGRNSERASPKEEEIR